MRASVFAEISGIALVVDHRLGRRSCVGPMIATSRAHAVLGYVDSSQIVSTAIGKRRLEAMGRSTP